MLFEESISSSSEKETALQAIIGTLHRCHVFKSENRGALAQTVSGYCANLLKKEEQCRAVCLYSHIFWQDEVSLQITVHCCCFIDGCNLHHTVLNCALSYKAVHAVLFLLQCCIAVCAVFFCCLTS